MDKDPVPEEETFYSIGKISCGAVEIASVEAGYENSVACPLKQFFLRTAASEGLQHWPCPRIHRRCQAGFPGDIAVSGYDGSMEGVKS